MCNKASDTKEHWLLECELLDKVRKDIFGISQFKKEKDAMAQLLDARDPRIGMFLNKALALRHLLDALEVGLDPVPSMKGVPLSQISDDIMRKRIEIGPLGEWTHKNVLTKSD